MKLLARIALICNLLFLVCLIIQRQPSYKGAAELNAYIVVIGWMMAPFVNLLVNAVYWIGRIINRSPNLPMWLVWVNLLFFLAQVYVYFILPT